MLRKSWNRLNQLFQDPSYRTKFGFFILVGFVLALVQSRISNPEWQNFLQEFSVTFVAIGIIQFLWDFLGGDPMELKINAISDDLIETKEALFSEMKTLNDEVVDELRDFKVSMRVMNDLVNGNLGIERIWPDRGRWQYDQTNGRKYWEDRLSNAKTIDIMSNTLWQSWLNPDEFSERFFSNIRRGARVRIILYDPKPRQDKKDPFTVLDMRAIDEEEINPDNKKPGDEMRLEINNSLKKLAVFWMSLEETQRDRLQVRLTYRSLQLVQIIKADEQMLLNSYLSGETGTPSPVQQLRGPESSYYNKYAEQFDIMWRRGKVLSATDFQEIADKYSDIAAPPAEES